MTEEPTHPNQPVVMVKGVVRFKQNAIVRFLLETSKNNLNDLSLMNFSADDWNQFAQLIGYSVSGFGDLSYADPERVEWADSLAEELVDHERAER